MEYIKFWRLTDEYSKFSPMYEDKFNGEDGRTYLTVEQYIFIQKALFFGRTDIAEKMLAEKITYNLSLLDAQIDTSIKEGWEKAAIEVAKTGYKLRMKYSVPLNDEIKQLKAKNILEKNTIFVYTQPYDKFWGVGLEARNYACEDPETWQGKNYMGIAVTEAFKWNEKRLEAL